MSDRTSTETKRDRLILVVNMYDDLLKKPDLSNSKYQIYRRRSHHNYNLLRNTKPVEVF